ncbi:MAG TPA: PhnD/SsuA/transferrin family substrate-binding protein [Gemmataceae bacterium]|nr:PhnD/SsuA/transferrin family substrate-binding protein [Gemmataceae bacterium]
MSRPCRRPRASALPGPVSLAHGPPPAALRCVTFLAPKLLGFYTFLAGRVARSLGCRVEVVVATSYDDLDAADVAFVCGLPYVERTRRGDCPVEPIAAPVLRGARYGGRPIYFSDVIVRRDSPCRSFADLRGRSWAYNEPLSQSGYGITRFVLARDGHAKGYFGRVVEAGWHERAVELVATGECDASAIDSQLLAVMFRDDPALADELRVIETLGPSTIQPVVVSRRLPRPVKSELQRTFLSLADDPAAQQPLAAALVERFVPVGDGDYDDLRRMSEAALTAGWHSLD